MSIFFRIRVESIPYILKISKKNFWEPKPLRGQTTKFLKKCFGVYEASRIQPRYSQASVRSGKYLKNSPKVAKMAIFGIGGQKTSLLAILGHKWPKNGLFE